MPAPARSTRLPSIWRTTTPSDGGTITVSLYSDDGGRPGQSIATLGVIDDKSLTNAATLVQLQAPSGLQLAAGTEYWILASDSATSKAVWFYDSSDAGVGTSGQSYDDRW